jgi:hypothetical protein
MGQGKSSLDDNESVLQGMGKQLSSEQVRELAKKYQGWRGQNTRLIKASKARQFVMDVVAADKEKELLLWVECNQRDERVWLGDFLARVFLKSDCALTESAQSYVDSVSSEPGHLTLAQVLDRTAPEQVEARQPPLK